MPTRPLRIFWPDFYTEAHRERKHGDALAKLLEAEGISCSPVWEPSCDAVFCGSIWRCRQTFGLSRKAPVIHFSWDLYPFQIDGSYSGSGHSLWLQYLEQLKTCKEVWVPSQCQVRRTYEYTGRDDAWVCLASVRPWDDLTPTQGVHIVDVMRKYPDPNRDAVALACRKLRVALRQTATTTPWEEFRSIVASSRLLVSAYYEASTGGLTLLEGHALGKPVLLSNSPYHGGVDYFGDRATYFQWDNQWDLRDKIASLHNDPQWPDPRECRAWVDEHYSEAAFARRVATRLKEIL